MSKHRCSACNRKSHKRPRCPLVLAGTAPAKKPTAHQTHLAQAIQDAQAMPRGSAGFGARLRVARMAASLSLRGLAAETGYAFESIGQWERGDRLPAMNKAEVLAKACKVTVADLMGDGKIK